LWWVCQG